MKLELSNKELELFLRKNIICIEDYLLNASKLAIAESGNLEIEPKNSEDMEVEVYKLLKYIYASFLYRDSRRFRDLKQQYSEQNIKSLVAKFESITKSIV